MTRPLLGQPGVRRNTCLFLLIIFLVALAARLGAVLYLGVPDIIEADEHGLNAARLVNGQGYTFDFYGYRVDRPLQSFKPPLYTFFLAAFLCCTNKPALALGISQAFLSSFTCVLIYLIAALLSGRTLGLVSSAATAIYPVFVIQAARPFSMTVHTLILAALLFSVLQLLRRSRFRDWAITGILVGLLVLGRPSMFGLLPVILLWIWLNSQRITHWRRAGFVITTFVLLTILPWTIRNYRIHHRIVPISTHGGFTFWNGNNPFTTGSAFDVYVDEVERYTGVQLEQQAGDSQIVDLRPYPLPKGLEAQLDTLTEVELDRTLYLAGLRFIRENPRQWLELEWRKLVSFWWFRPNIGRSRADLGEHGLVYDDRWILPYKILYGGVLVFFVVGLGISLGRWRVHSLFYLTFGYLTAIYTAFEVMTRYRWEIEPFILIFAVVAGSYVARHALPMLNHSVASSRAAGLRPAVRGDRMLDER